MKVASRDARTDEENRRASTRYTPATPWGRLAWGVGRPPYLSFPARLIDISEGGMQVLTASPPPPPGCVWVRIDDLPWEWVRATVRAVKARRGRRALWSLHLAFCEPCPAGVMDRALGYDPEADPRATAVSDAPGAVPMSFWFEREP